MKSKNSVMHQKNIVLKIKQELTYKLKKLTNDSFIKEFFERCLGVCEETFNLIFFDHEIPFKLKDNLIFHELRSNNIDKKIILSYFRTTFLALIGWSYYSMNDTTELFLQNKNIIIFDTTRSLVLGDLINVYINLFV